MPAKGSQRPLITKVVLLAIFILDELVILLVDTVVGEMHILVVLVYLGGICLTSESRQTLLENIDPEWFITCDENVDSKIKFMTVNKKRISNISGYNG